MTTAPPTTPHPPSHHRKATAITQSDSVVWLSAILQGGSITKLKARKNLKENQNKSTIYIYIYIGKGIL